MINSIFSFSDTPTHKLSNICKSTDRQRNKNNISKTRTENPNNSIDQCTRLLFSTQMTQLRHSKRDHCPIVELFQGMPLRLQAMTSTLTNASVRI